MTESKNQTNFITEIENKNLDSYRKGVELLAKNQSSEINYNSGSKHAMIVMENLINNSNNNINIFAGNFDDKVCNVGESKYYISLEKYLIRGGQINVLLNNFKIDTYNKTLDLLKQFSATEKYTAKISIKITEYKPILNKNEYHFTVADNKAFREEYDIENFRAKFSFNQPEKAKELNTQFEKMFNDNAKSSILDLSTLNY